MSSAIAKLTRRAEFLFVQKGLKAGRGDLLIEARKRAEAGAVRFGVTASRKVGGAVARNRAKRRLRAIARGLLPRHGVAGADYVFVARPSTPEAPWTRLLDDAENALLRLKPQLSAASPPPAKSTATRD